MSQDFLSTVADTWRVPRPTKTQTPAQFRLAICARVKATREAHHRTQEFVADKLGLATGTYAKYEGRSLMPVHYWPAFCELFGVTCWFLLTGQAIQSHPDQSSPPPPTRPPFRRVG